MNFNKITVLMFLSMLCSIQINKGMYGSRGLTVREARAIGKKEHRLKRLNEKLINASKNGNIKETQEAINDGANVNSNIDGETPLSAAIENNHLNIAQLLINNQADIDKKFGSGYTLLIQSATRGNLDAVKFLLANGADMNITYDHGINFRNMDAIKIAEAYRNLDVANYLKNYKAAKEKMITDSTSLPTVLTDLIYEYTGDKPVKSKSTACDIGD